MKILKVYTALGYQGIDGIVVLLDLIECLQKLI